MIPAFYNKEARGSRVIDLAVGRVLFLPRGRGGPGYAIADYLEAYTLQGRME